MGWCWNIGICWMMLDGIGLCWMMLRGVGVCWMYLGHVHRCSLICSPSIGLEVEWISPDFVASLAPEPNPMSVIGMLQ